MPRMPSSSATTRVIALSFTLLLLLQPMSLVAQAESLQEGSEKRQKLLELVQSMTDLVVKMQGQEQERISAEGNSGVSEIRGYASASETYRRPVYSATNQHLGMHDHPESSRTLGLAELSAVLNGVQFSTRHNDHTLSRPVNFSGADSYNKLEPIPFPDVPPSVLAQSSVSAQVNEMAEYFRAWQAQDTSIRDYKPYFRAAICVLEGTWIKDTPHITEPFESPLASIEATSWEQLRLADQYLSTTGRQSEEGNMPFLPKIVRGMAPGSTVENPKLEMANFEARVFCHPIERDLPLNRFRPVDDLAAQMFEFPMTVAELASSRRGHFKLNPRDQEQWYDGRHTYEFLDSLMEQIPGKDNYGADLAETTVNGETTKHYLDPSKRLNAGYYSRYYRTVTPDANNRKKQRRGFNDAYLWAARTTQEAVSGLRYGNTEEKWSWAIPLEITYLTPLFNWNPYNLPVKADPTDEGSRDGVSVPFNGIDAEHFYQTPAEFFSAVSEDTDAADTGLHIAQVIDSEGQVREVSPSGSRILLPPVKGLSHRPRLRYPIAPFHDSKSNAYKNARALKHSLQNTELTSFLLEGDFANLSVNAVTLYTDPATTNGRHVHVVEVAPSDVQALHDGETVTLTSDLANAHTHTFDVFAEKVGDNWVYYITTCDDLPAVCLDGHAALCEVADSCSASVAASSNEASATSGEVDSTKIILAPWAVILFVIQVILLLLMGASYYYLVKVKQVIDD